MMNVFKQIINGLIYKIAPIKSNRIVFTSLHGQYSDSPKAISVEFHKSYPHFEIIWLLNQAKINEIPEYVTAVDINSIKAHYYSGSSKIIIDNVYAENAITIYDNDTKAIIRAKIFLWLHRKRKQLIFTTWHGTPIKKMGIDQINNHISDFICNKMTMILGDQYTLNIMKRLTFNRIDMNLLGTARNDVLYDQDHSLMIRKRLGLDNKKILLFAPTFRSGELQSNGRYIERSGLDQINDIDFDELFRILSKKFGGEWVFICRFHYHVAEKVDWKDIEERHNGRVINGNTLQDMADYLSCADILISDISSCMFDFALTKRPCFILFPDKEQFESNERGLYINLDSLPFPFAVNNIELLSNIENFDDLKYKSKLCTITETFGFVNEGNSSEKIVNYIVEKSRTNEK